MKSKRLLTFAGVFLVIAFAFWLGTRSAIPVLTQEEEQAWSEHRSRPAKNKVTATDNTHFEKPQVDESNRSLFTVSLDPFVENHPDKKAFLKANQQGHVALRQFALQALQKDEIGSLELFAKLQNGINYEILGAAIQEHFSEDSRLGELLEAFPLLNENPTLATPLLAQITSEYYQQKPKAVLQWIQENHQLNGIPNALQELGQMVGKNENPAAELHEILSIGFRPEERARILTGALSEWVHRDMEASFNFLKQNRFTSEYDEAVYNMAATAADYDPETAMLWINDLKKPEFRLSGMYEVSRRWIVKDREAFFEWFQQQSPKTQYYLKDGLDQL